MKNKFITLSIIIFSLLAAFSPNPAHADSLISGLVSKNDNFQSISIHLFNTYKEDRHPNPPTPQSSPWVGNRAALDAAKVSYVAALKQAQNGRDLAFADANANLMQSLQSAGKDKAANAAALAAYKAAATVISAAFKEAITRAMSDYKTALQTINGK